MASKTINLQVKLKFSGKVMNRARVVKNVLDALRWGADHYGIAPQDDDVLTESIEVRDPVRDVSQAVCIGLSTEQNAKDNSQLRV